MFQGVTQGLSQNGRFPQYVVRISGRYHLYIVETWNFATAHFLICGYSSQDGENWTETDVKLACKTVFVQFSTSGGRPMLLVRHSRTRRCPP